MVHFRLERVLAYRRLQVEVLEQELLERCNTLQHEESTLQELHTSCRQQEEELAASEGQRLSGEVLQMWHRHYHALDGQVQQQHAAVLVATQTLAQTQQEVVAARQRQKTLEKMAETAHQRHALQMARSEQQRLDEIGTTRSQPVGVTGRSLLL